MKIELREVSIYEVTNGYINNAEDGVVGYGGNLNIRPKYQREFVYRDRQGDSVIETARKNFPLNVMYWVKNSDNTYEVLDLKKPSNARGFLLIGVRDADCAWNAWISSFQ